MTLRYTVYREQQIIITNASGRLTLDNMKKHMQTVQKHPDIEPDFNHIFDLREAVKIDITTGDVKQLAEFSFFNEQSKRAIVAPTDLFYGMSRMYEVFKNESSVNIKVFRNYEEAKEWVGYVEPGKSTTSRAG